MRFPYLVHIAAGALGLLSGYIALFSAKGAPRHRKIGMVFVYAMLTMCIFGVYIAATRNSAPELNIPAGVMTAYLVATGLITVKPPASGARGLGIGLTVVALGVGLLDLTLGFEAVVNGGSTRGGYPAFPFFMFGTVGLLAGVSDFRVIRFGSLAGVARLARHLWRMCFALFVAAMSFFIGQADELPQFLRIPALLAIPPLVVLVTMLYWVWRIRARRLHFQGNHLRPSLRQFSVSTAQPPPSSP